ncbi:aminoglycoside phosphotransferase family protein [Streptomyces sp. NPDC126503]|uniref:aminoglycoside phosphotransferase family protein n=1 Tax=Streptomyces sp. NPDC126503 TaxID=3155315 RepID=UPI003334A456
MIEVPEEFARAQAAYNGAAGRAFVAALPGRAEEFLERWGLRVTGPPMHGAASLVLPVVRGRGPAVLKLQLLDEETEGEPAALRAWDGRGAVRLLDHDPATGTMLLERLDAGRSPARLPDRRRAVEVLAGLLARLTAVPAPPRLRGLGGIAARMVADAPAAAVRLRHAGDAALLRDWAAAVRDVADEPGDRLLHWDLHEGNVLAADREPWLAIDPKPLSGDPGFELLPALRGRTEAGSGGEVDPAEVLWRFDLLTERLGLDRGRAAAWTLGRVLQNALWDIEDGAVALDAGQAALAGALRARRE